MFPTLTAGALARHHIAGRTLPPEHLPPALPTPGIFRFDNEHTARVPFQPPTPRRVALPLDTVAAVFYTARLLHLRFGHYHHTASGLLPTYRLPADFADMGTADSPMRWLQTATAGFTC